MVGYICLIIFNNIFYLT